MVTGIQSIFCHSAFTLFDFGSMHSFFSERFVEHPHLELEPLEFTSIVFTPADKLLLAIHRVKAGSVRVSERVLDATLIVLCIHDFDIMIYASSD